MCIRDRADRDNIAQFELIPWLLGQCATLNEARTLIERMNLLNVRKVLCYTKT